MENLPAIEGHEDSATNLNGGENGFKITRAISRLRFNMSRQQPVNKVRCQLEEIQTDYDEVVGLLSKLYKYTDEAYSVTLRKWESALREDLVSVERDVSDYDQGNQTPGDDVQTDTGWLGPSVTERPDIEQLSTTTNDDISLPPQDLGFNKLLLKISKSVPDDELMLMKVLFRGPGIIGKRDLDGISHPIEFFDQLQKSGHLTPNNIVVLQAVLWHIGNIELFNEVTQFAEKMGDMVYASVPSSTPANGYAYVKVHYKKKPSRQTVEDLRQRTAAWFEIPLQFVSVAGSEQANSWYITFMIPEIFTKKFQMYIELNRKWFSDQGIDSVELNGRTIDVTDEQATDPEGCTGDMGDIAKPTLRFTETDNERLRITDEGSVVEAEDLYWPGCRAVTDGRFRAGRYYWRLQITCSPGYFCSCYVGVVQEGCGLWPVINPGSDSWYIEMVYGDDKVWCFSDCDGEIKPDYQQRRPHTGPHHVGVYLDCDQRSLIILDCDHNQVMATVRGLRVTEPLVPWVRFYCGQSVSARLVTGDSATLPEVLCDMLNTS